MWLRTYRSSIAASGVTPMRRSHFLLSYFFSRCFFLALELSVLVAFGYLAFGTAVRGHLLSLALVSLAG